ncbi:MAG: sugar phosphate nucleotidyltransferase [Nanoarchaeota archaeon]|nr:hypothetical protein [Nanoarchaeota archaeon]
MKKKISITINDKILRDIDSIVDNIFIRNRSQGIEYLIKKALKESKIAIILAGESMKGSPDKIRNRYGLKVGHLTIIEKIVRKLSDSGFKKIYLIANHLTLTNIFKIIGDGSDYKVKIEFVNEEIEQGTASALKLLKNKINNTFLVVHCDLIFDDVNLLELWQKHLDEKKVATLLVSSPVVEPNKPLTGNVKLEGNNIIAYIEKPNRKKINSAIFCRGIFVAEPEIFSYSGKSLEFDVWPELAKKMLLGGHVSCTEHLHVHTHEDLINVRKKLMKE